MNSPLLIVREATRAEYLAQVAWMKGRAPFGSACAPYAWEGYYFYEVTTD